MYLFYILSLECTWSRRQTLYQQYVDVSIDLKFDNRFKLAVMMHIQYFVCPPSAAWVSSWPGITNARILEVERYIIPCIHLTSSHSPSDFHPLVPDWIHIGTAARPWPIPENGSLYGLCVLGHYCSGRLLEQMTASRCPEYECSVWSKFPFIGTVHLQKS